MPLHFKFVLGAVVLVDFFVSFVAEEATNWAIPRVVAAHRAWKRARAKQQFRRLAFAAQHEYTAESAARRRAFFPFGSSTTTAATAPPAQTAPAVVVGQQYHQQQQQRQQQQQQQLMYQRQLQQRAAAARNRQQQQQQQQQKRSGGGRGGGALGKDKRADSVEALLAAQRDQRLAEKGKFARSPRAGSGASEHTALLWTPFGTMQDMHICFRDDDGASASERDT